MSLSRVDYYGLGPDTTPLNHTTFGFTENITGLDAAVPISIGKSTPKIAIVAELNGRFPAVRPGAENHVPSIDYLFTESSAPGLNRQPPFVQPSEGLRIFPSLFGDRIRLNYLLQFQQFWAPGDSAYSFRRFNGDFSHEIPLTIFSKSMGKFYDSKRAAVFPHNGPDDCTAAGRENNAMPCPPVSVTQKLEGSIALRAFFSESFAGSGSRVPFYFSPTIGGSDINGTPMLPSYPDYRFRGPDLLLFRGTVEHSLGPLPIGALFSVDEGKIGMRRDDISIDHLHHSFAVGLTVRAGGLPLISFLYTWGGNKGHTSSRTSAPHCWAVPHARPCSESLRRSDNARYPIGRAPWPVSRKASQEWSCAIISSSSGSLRTMHAVESASDSAAVSARTQARFCRNAGGRYADREYGFALHRQP